jgi:hypothetical protein
MTIRKRYLLAVPFAALVVGGAGFAGTALAGAAPTMSGGTSVVEVGDQIRDQLRDGSCDSTCAGTPDQLRDRAKDGTTVAGDQLKTRDQLKDQDRDPLKLHDGSCKL